MPGGRDNERAWMLAIHFWMTRSTKKPSRANEAQWDLLRTFEAIARLGSVTAAAKALEISQSTASRHLARLEEEAGSPLLLREQPLRLTERGQAVLAALQPMVDASLAAHAALEKTSELRGEVTITTIAETLRWSFVPHLASFYRMYPHLRLRVLANNQVTSLATGDADVALRLVRPASGDLVAKRLSVARFAYYASPSLALHSDVPWLGLTGSLAQIPWQRLADKVFAPRPARLLVEDPESLALSVRAGLGVAILPTGFAERIGLVEVRAKDIGADTSTPIPTGELWIVVHRGKQRLPKVRAVIHWLESILRDA